MWQRISYANAWWGQLPWATISVNVDMKLRTKRLQGRIHTDLPFQEKFRCLHKMKKTTDWKAYYNVCSKWLNILWWCRSQWVQDLTEWMKFQRNNTQSPDDGVEPIPETSWILNIIPQILGSVQRNDHVMNRSLLPSYKPSGNQRICYPAEFGLTILCSC
jgi:hypothetical protein